MSGARLRGRVDQGTRAQQVDRVHGVLAAAASRVGGGHYRIGANARGVQRGRILQVANRDLGAHALQRAVPRSTTAEGADLHALRQQLANDPSAQLSRAADHQNHAEHLRVASF